jgi:hypothetical protein
MKSAVLVTLASMLALGLASERSWAQPTSFTYQGELKQSGQNATGTFDMQFRLYDLPNGGTQIGSTQCADNVSVAAGRFTTSVDFGQQFATTAARYLEIAVRTDSGLTCASSAGFTLLSRQLLTVAPRAAAANVANALAAPDGSPNPAVFVDNAGQVGIGTNSPVAVLDVRGPGSSYFRFDNVFGDLRANGGTDGFFGIVNEGSSTTGRTEFLNGLNARLVSIENSGRVGIGALPNGVDRLFVNGTIATTPIVRYKTIHGSEFIPSVVSRDTGGFMYADEAGATGYGFGNPFFAPVDLPHGAVVTQLRVYAIDERPTDISVTMGRTELATGGTAAMATVGTTGSSSSVQSPFWNNIVWSTILNDTHAYWLKANLDSFGNARHKIIGVRITYTVTQPSP